MDVHETGHAEPSEYIESPIYRVNFWERPQPGFAFNLDAFVLSGAADVEEVLSWIAENARDRMYELLVEVDSEKIEPGLQIRSAALIHLSGADPNSSSSSSSSPT